MDPFVFINYRRDDTISAARALLRFFHTHYGRDRVFMDIAEIRYGERWESSIRDALERATVLITLVGPQWLKLTDQYGVRRIDKDDDWVVTEIDYANRFGKRIYPVFIDTPIIARDSLPERLQFLPTLLGFQVSKESVIEEVWRKLCESMQRQDGFPALLHNVVYPQPRVRLQPIPRSELNVRLQELDGWSPVASPLPGAEHVIRSELYRRFEFSSFKKAIQFMTEAAPEIDEKQHHPRWENVWRNVDVWLSTWDIQFQISDLDLELAVHLNDTARRVRKE